MPQGVLVIGTEERAALHRLREAAAAAPVDVRAVMEAIKTPEGDQQHRERMARLTIPLPAHYEVTFSVELGQPVGPCRHMSMSTARADRVPRPEAVWMVAEELGFTGTIADCASWLEDLRGGGKAVNLVQPVALAPRATA